jgi:hypothetical protein
LEVSFDLIKGVLTPYQEAPALNVSLNARQARVVYPPADLPIMHSLSPSTLPCATLSTEELTVRIQVSVLKIHIHNAPFATKPQVVRSTIKAYQVVSTAAAIIHIHNAPFAQESFPILPPITFTNAKNFRQAYFHKTQFQK